MSSVRGDAPAPTRGRTVDATRLAEPTSIGADLSLQERLDAFEDVFESEVGDTNLTRARNLEREHGIRQLYVKFESNNPTGSQKDRIAFAQVADALRRGFDTVTVASCGNYGAAMAFACKVAGIGCRIFVPESYHSKRIDEIVGYGANVERHGADYESAVEHSSAVADTEELYDANPGGANTSIQLKAYGEIAYEIYDELRDAPAAVACPVSNGTVLAGIYRGFVSLHRRGKTSRIPRMVAGSALRTNPIVLAFSKGLTKCSDLPADSVHETEINEPLINWRSLDGQGALDAIWDSGGWAAAAADRTLAQTARQLRDSEGLSVLPAATAGLVALLDRHRREPLPSDRYVAVLTARR